MFCHLLAELRLSNYKTTVEIELLYKSQKKNKILLTICKSVSYKK